MMKKIIIIDGNSLAYSRIPDEDKTPKEALYSSIDNRDIFITRKFIRKILRYKYIIYAGYQLIVIFDEQNKHTFRHELSDKYKSKKLNEKRKAQKNYVYSQIDEIKILLNKMNIPNYSTNRWEADDVIGMLIEKLEKRNYLTTIVSGDKDILQLISTKTRVLYLSNDHKMIIADRKTVWDVSGGIWPDQVIDTKILSGDSSDNIKGMGLLRNGKVDYWTDTEAKEYIKKWNSIENMIKNIDLIDDPYKKSLIKGQEKIILNRKLITIIRKWELDNVNFEYFINTHINKNEVQNTITDLNLESLIKNKRFRNNFEGKK